MVQIDRNCLQLLCRTAIALEQEKVIERNTKEIKDLKSEVAATKQNMDKLTTELENLKEKYETNDKALKDRDETIKNNNMGKKFNIIMLHTHLTNKIQMLVY